MNNKTKNVQLKKNEIEKDKKEQDEMLFEMFSAVIESNNFETEFFHFQDQKKSKDRNKK